MKTILLTPYPGRVILCKTLAELGRAYRAHTGDKCPEKWALEPCDGRTITLAHHSAQTPRYLVYGKNAPSLAHEFGHVLLEHFEYIGSNPAEGNGEPFCYAMSHLMHEALKK